MAGGTARSGATDPGPRPAYSTRCWIRFQSPAIIDVTDVGDRPDIELFGPVLQMIRVPNFDAALIEANNTRFGLSASLIGGAAEFYDRF